VRIANRAGSCTRRLDFQEKLKGEHQIDLSYTWVKAALQGAGLVARARKRGVHRQRPERVVPISDSLREDIESGATD